MGSENSEKILCRHNIKGSIDLVRGIKSTQDPENIFGVKNNIVLD